MVYKITFDSFTKINEQAGTIQNVGDYIIEMSESPTFDSGILILPNQKSTFNNTDIYLRCIEQGFSSEVRIVPFIVDAKGGDGSSVDTTALKSVALVGNALNFYTSSDTAQAAYSIDIPAEQFIDQASTSFVPNFYFSAILYPDAVNPNLNGKPVFVLGVKTKSNDGLSNTVKYSFIDVSKLVDTYVASDTSVTVSDYKFKVNISPDAGNYLRLKANGVFAGTITDTATSSVFGLTKLYGTTGANTDGTLTQSAITAELAAKLDSDAKAVSATTADKLSTARSLKVSLSSSSATTFDGSANVTIGVGGILPTTYGGTGNANGTVSGAAQLNTSRNFITNLNSTVAGGFNGTASVSAGITGTLPVANGGTGQTNLDNVTVGKAIKDSSGNVISDTYATKTALSAGLNSKLDSDATAAAAFKDSAGNVITDTYVTKTELNHKLNAVRYGYRIKQSEPDPYERVEYLYDAVGMIPAHMVYDTDSDTSGTDSDSSYFDYGSWRDVWFVRDNKPCMLKSDGTVDYYLDPNDYSKCAEPVTRTVIVDTDTQATESITFTDSEVADSTYDGNAMASFPLVWVKRYTEGDYVYEIVSNVQWDETYKAYAHTDSGGNVKDYFYWGLFPAGGSSSKLRSISGQNKLNKLAPANALTAAAANGAGWSVSSWSQWQLIRTLFTLMGRSNYIYKVFGTTGTIENTATGYIPFGEGNTRGQFFGFPSPTIAQKRTSKYFHIGQFFDRTILTGLINNKLNVYYKLTPPYSFTSTSGYTLFKKYADGAFSGNPVNGLPATMQLGNYGALPVDNKASWTTYWCCVWIISNASMAIFSCRIIGANNYLHQNANNFTSDVLHAGFLLSYV